MADNGVKQISLADTVGLATPKQVADVVADVIAVHDNLEIGVHLHARPDNAAAKVRAAYEAGCRRFDAAVGGVGGGAFGQGAAVGNMEMGSLLGEVKGFWGGGARVRAGGGFCGGRGENVRGRVRRV